MTHLPGMMLPGMRHKKKPTTKVGFFEEFLVGTRGFEPPTPDTP